MTQHSSVAPSKKNSADLNLVSAHELFEHTQGVFNLIAQRAFEIFESRGHAHGNDREDWFLAESELLKPVKCHVRESDDHLIAHAEVPGFGPHEIKVSIEPRWLRISARTETPQNRNAGEAIIYSLGHSLLPAEQIFHVAELSATVDPSKSKVTFKDGMLEIVMPKAAPVKGVRAETKPALSVEGDTSVHETSGIEAAGSPPVVTGANKPIVKTQVASSKR